MRRGNVKPHGRREDDRIWMVAEDDRDKRPGTNWSSGLKGNWEWGSGSSGSRGVTSGPHGPLGQCQRTTLPPKVSHHPPISACHAESENFVFWQGKEWGAWWGGCGGEGHVVGGGCWNSLVSFLPLSQPTSRHEVEEQVLGQILGDCACGDSQRQPAQVGVHKCSAAQAQSTGILWAGVARW